MNGDSRSWYQPPEVMTDGHHKSGIILVAAGLMIRDVTLETVNTRGEMRFSEVFFSL